MKTNDMKANKITMDVLNPKSKTSRIRDKKHRIAYLKALAGSRRDLDRRR